MNGKSKNSTHSPISPQNFYHLIKSKIHPIALVHLFFRLIAITLVFITTLIFLFVAYGLITQSFRFTPILSSSMSPAMPKNSLALLTQHKVNDLKVGDIVVFRDPTPAHNNIAHRIVDITKSKKDLLFTTKGDANASLDNWKIKFHDKNIWVVKKSVSHLGFPFAYVANTHIVVALLILGILYYF